MKKIHAFLRHFFIPSEHNQFRARLLHNDTFTAYLVVIFVCVFIFRFTPLDAGQVLGVATDIKIEQLLSETNEERSRNNLPELSYDSKLTRAAQLKAQDMLANNYWAHYSPQGKTPWDFLLQAGYQYEFAGENLAKNFMYSDQVVDAWMKSPTHRENLMRREFTQVGFAVQNGVLDGEETTLVVQMFGTPLPVELGGDPETAPPKAGPAGERVLSESSQQSGIPTFSLILSYFFIGALIIAFFADLFTISRLDIVRLQGKNAAHLVFLITMLIGIIFFITKGTII